MVAIEWAKVELTGMLNKLGLNNETGPEGWSEMLNDGEMRKVPTERKESTRGLFIPGGYGVGLLRRLCARVAMDFNSQGTPNFWLSSMIWMAMRTALSMGYRGRQAGH